MNVFICLFMLELLVGGLLMEQEGQRKVKTNPGINSFHN